MYKIYLSEVEIGSTLFEHADASMGVVFGKIMFINGISGYEYFRQYCLEQNIRLLSDYPEIKLLSTPTLHKLLVKNNKGREIKCLSNQVSGMDEDGFEISLEGISYPFYETEFPQHIIGKNA